MPVSSVPLLSMAACPWVRSWQLWQSKHVYAEAPPARSKSTEACTQVELIAIAQFLQDSQSQLTVSGLVQLAESMSQGSVAAFFRNNHFNTLYKHSDGALYVLVTDEGYSNEEGVVWERLCSEVGDTTYATGEFEPYGVFQQKQVAEQEEALRQIRLAEEVRRA